MLIPHQATGHISERQPHGNPCVLVGDGLITHGCVLVVLCNYTLKKRTGAPEDFLNLYKPVLSVERRNL